MVNDKISKLLKFSPMYYTPGEDDIIYLNLNVSDICNYRCLKCFQGKITPSHDSLDLEELISIVDQAKDELDIKAIYISGRGETFLVGKGDLKKKLQNYRKLIEHATSRGLGIVQFTNGYYLDPEMTEFLAEKEVAVVVSLDTLDEHKYHQLFLPPKHAFQRVMANIDFARGKFPIEEAERRIYCFGINTAISHVNIAEVERIRDFCAEDIIFFSNYPMVKGKFRDNLEKMCISEQEYEEFKIKVRETSAYHALAGICQTGVCGFYYNGITIDVNGNVLLSPYDIHIGSSFGDIKNYPNMKQAFKTVKNVIKRFLNEYPDAKGCPLRHPNYELIDKFL